MNRLALPTAIFTLISAAAVTLAGQFVTAGPSTAAPQSTAKPVSISKADADRESQLVAGEDRRLQDIRTISTLARWQNRTQKAPYRVGTAAGYTLVLTARSEPYVLADLLKLEPQTLVRLSDGSYLLNEHIIVLSGAELNLSSPGLTLRLASSPSGFVSIVSMGGRVELVGTSDHPVHLTSWDARLAADDVTTSDGRAYIRAIGGQMQLSYVRADDLGFWSGRTGSVDPKAAKAATGNGSVGGVAVLPTGPLPKGSKTPSDTDVYVNTFVAARIDHVRTSRNAFGLFVSGADGILVDESAFLDSQIAGVDFHRFVSGSAVQRTVSNNSGGDGFNLGRATQGVQISQSTASGNAGNGFVLSGEPLADGPSAVGSPVNVYGNNLLSNSTADHNGHYGVYVKDGFNVTVSGNHIRHSEMGIVAREQASRITITGNQVSGVSGHAIALLEGVGTSTVTGNLVKGGTIYLRDSQAEVQGNTVLDAHGHGISVVGDSGGTVVANNVASGTGSSAIDIARASGSITAHGNTTNGWHDTTSLLVRYTHMLLHPMSLLWVTILALVLLSMIKGIRRRHVERGTNPYSHQSAHLIRAHA